MRKFLSIGIVSSVLIVGIACVGVSTDIYANGSHSTSKQIATPVTSHTVPPQQQGKPVPPNPDPGIDSLYTSKTTDIGFTADINSLKNPDPGMIPQYPRSFQPPNAHPATSGQAPKKN